MHLLLILLLATQESPSDPILQAFKDPGEHLKLYLPRSYEKDPKISLMFTRKANRESNDAVNLRLAFLNQKLPLVPVAPTEADLLKVDPSLTYVKFTGSVGTWQGRSVPMGRYEGFVQGKIGVYGRVVWLPLEPGSVVLDLYAEPAWMGGLDHDWNLILNTISGPIVEVTLRERAPNRWLAAKILGGFGVLVASAGILMLIARMNESIGGSLTFAALILPVIPLGYALFHLHECRRGMAVALTGLALFGLSLLLLR